MSGRSTRNRIVAGVAVGVLLVGVLTWALWPSSDERAPREREYKAAVACLLTDDKGLAGEQAKTVWAGMQDASLATRVRVQYLTVNGPQTTANALSYFNSLGMQKCVMILAVGKAPVGAMIDGHTRFSDVKHVAVGGEVKPDAITKVAVGPPEQVRRSVSDLVRTIG